MQLVNHTPVPADLTVSHIEGLAHRLGILTAKATFRFEPGRTELDTQTPFGILARDEPTELGLLPVDITLRRDDAFEVILLGAAHAPEGEARTEQRVCLQVGDAERELAVFGDRVWDPSGDEPVISEPLPYSRMPLIWERAHGGRCDVEIDREAFIEVADPYNPRGRGFDAAALAQSYADAFAAPAGYPMLEYLRRLPNVEDPACLIRSWDDAPKPACWATVPLGLPFHQSRLADAITNAAAEQHEAGPAGLSDSLGALPTIDGRPALSHLFHRAHPSWIVARPAAGAEVTMSGLSPVGPMSFPLPEMRVIADYVIGDRTGSRELMPQLLVMLPDARRLYLVYRALFGVVYDSTVERSMRLRLEDGWFAGTESQQSTR